MCDIVNFVVTSDQRVINLEEYFVPFCVHNGGAAYVPFPESVLRKLFDVVDSHESIDDSKVSDEEYEQMVTFASAIDEDKDVGPYRYNLYPCKGMHHIFTGCDKLVKALKKGDTRPIDFYLYDHSYTSLDDSYVDTDDAQHIILVDEGSMYPTLVNNLTEALRNFPRKLLYLADDAKELAAKLPLDRVEIVAIQSAEPMDINHPGYIHVPLH